MNKMIQITINNKIYIKGMSTDRQKNFKKLLTLDNPVFHTMKAMKKSVWGIQRYFKYYSTLGNDLVIPRGMLTRLMHFLHRYDVKYTLNDQRNVKKLDTDLPEFKLRDYQQKICDKLFPEDDEPQEGMIVMTTGSGKTVMAAEIVRRLGLKATILVSKQTLLHQFASEFKRFVNYDVGKMYSKEKTMKDITVATWGILRNKERLEELIQQTSVLIIDEAQDVASPKRKEIIQSFNPKYMYGLTATPLRTDGQTQGIFFLVGSEIEDYKGKQMKPKVEIWHTKEDIPVRPEYHEMIDEMIENDGRNTLITYIAMEEISKGRKVLVLTKRIEHYEKIHKKLPDSDMIYAMDSSSPDRDWLLGGMKNGLVDFNCILGTTALLSCGVDIPSLDTVIIACDMRSPVLTIQSVGRIRRLFEGKAEPKVIDLHDSRNYKLNKQAKERLKLYRKKEWEIKEINIDYGH